MKGRILFITMAFMFAMASIATAATVTQNITYQGTLTDSSGNPLTGTYSMTFRLYNVTSGGTALATSIQPVQCTNGLFTIPVTFDSSFFDGRALWLGIAVGSDPEMTPRQEMSPVPYALSLRPGAVINGSSAIPVVSVNTLGSGTAIFGTSSSGKGVYGSSTSGIGVNGAGYYGVYGWGSPNGIGVVGDSNSNIGVEGDCDTTGKGVKGWSNNGIGVYGETWNSNGNYGLYTPDNLYVGGKSTSINGVYGTSTSGYGVQGSSASSVGVYGNSTSGKGVQGDSTSGIGVYGTGASDTGVYGVGKTGVQGMGTSSDGVYGKTTSGWAGVGGSGPTYGVWGDSPGGLGVYGSGTSGVYGSGTSGVGMHGISTSDDGVLGETTSGPAGVAGQGPSTRGIWGASTSGIGVVGTSSSGHAIEAISDQSYGLYADTHNANSYGIYTDDRLYAGGGVFPTSDVAEYMPVTGNVTPGTVLVIGDDGKLHVTSTANDTRVAGIVSTAPGISLGAKNNGNPGEQVIAVAGRVPCKVDATHAPVHAGDLLTTSDKPGYAMKAEPTMINGRGFYPDGTILGKAMGSLESGIGTIDVLVTLQ